MSLFNLFSHCYLNHSLTTQYVPLQPFLSLLFKPLTYNSVCPSSAFSLIAIETTHLQLSMSLFSLFSHCYWNHSLTTQYVPLQPFLSLLFKPLTYNSVCPSSTFSLIAIETTHLQLSMSLFNLFSHCYLNHSLTTQYVPLQPFLSLLFKPLTYNSVCPSSTFSLIAI